MYCLHNTVEPQLRNLGHSWSEMFINWNYPPIGLKVKWINLFLDLFNSLWFLFSKDFHSSCKIGSFDHFFIFEKSTDCWFCHIKLSGKRHKHHFHIWLWFLSSAIMILVIFIFTLLISLMFFGSMLPCLIIYDKKEYKTQWNSREDATNSSMVMSLHVVTCLCVCCSIHHLSSETDFVWKICSWWEAFLTWDSTV